MMAGEVWFLGKKEVSATFLVFYKEIAQFLAYCKLALATMGLYQSRILWIASSFGSACPPSYFCINENEISVQPVKFYFV